MKSIVFSDSSKMELDALFTKLEFEQQCDIPNQLGCEFTEQGFIKIDDFNKTSVKGVFAAGDNTTHFRALSMAIGSGTKAGAVMNKEMVDEEFD
jgi:thioredoxin reductase